MVNRRWILPLLFAIVLPGLLLLIDLSRPSPTMLHWGIYLAVAAVGVAIGGPIAHRRHPGYGETVPRQVPPTSIS